MWSRRLILMIALMILPSELNVALASPGRLRSDRQVAAAGIPGCR